MATKKKVLSRSDFATLVRPTEPVELPELGGIVYVQGLTGAERDRYEQSVMQRRGGQLVPNLTNARAKLIVVSLVDEDGAVLFREDEVAELGNIPARTLQKIWDKACELSGLSESDVDELEGNSEAVRDDGNSSASQATSASPSKSSVTASQAAS